MKNNKKKLYFLKVIYLRGKDGDHVMMMMMMMMMRTYAVQYIIFNNPHQFVYVPLSHRPPGYFYVLGAFC